MAATTNPFDLSSSTTKTQAPQTGTMPVNLTLTGNPVPVPQAAQDPAVPGGPQPAQQPTPVQAPASGIIGAQLQQVTAPDTTKSVATGTASTYNAAAAGSTGYDAERMAASNWSVDKNQTVAGQLDGILSSNSPVLQKAQADALQTANARGLLNSSMAAGAGTGALLDRALQIATPDAQVNANSAQYNATAANTAAARNQDAGNTAAQFTAGAKNTADLTNAQAQNQAGQFNANSQTQVSLANAQAQNQATSQSAAFLMDAAKLNQNQAFQVAAMEYDAAFKASMANADAANKIQLTQLDGQIRTQLTELEARYKTQMQTSQSASTMYAQTMQEVGKIMANPDLDGAAKQNLINQMMSSLRNSLELQAGISSIPDLEDLIGNLDVGVVDETLRNNGGNSGGGIIDGEAGAPPAAGQPQTPQQRQDAAQRELESMWRNGTGDVRTRLEELRRSGIIGETTYREWFNMYGFPPDPYADGR